MNASTTSQIQKPVADPQSVALGILFALSLSHLLNDTIQALLPAVYPLLKDSFQLSFAQIGMITFCFQMVGSVFQPLRFKIELLTRLIDIHDLKLRT